MAYYKCGKIFATQNSNTSIETASGAIANFNTSLSMPVLDCIAEFSATQDLNGQDNPYPAGGGKNKFSIDFLTASGITISNGEASGSAYTFADKFGATKLIPNLTLGANTQYTLSFDAYTDGNTSTSGNGLYVAFKYDDDSTTPVRCPNNTSSYKRFTISNDTSKNLVGIFISYNSTSSNIWHLRNIQLELGNQATTFAPYSNICPIVGVDKVNVTRTGKNLIAGTIESAGINSAGVIGSSSSNNVIYAPCKAGVKYSVTSSESNKVYAFYTSEPIKTSGSYNGSRSSTSSGVVTITAEIDGWLAVRVPNTDTTPQIEYGESVTTYEAPTVVNIIINLGGTYYGGEVDAVTGKITLTYKLVVLDGSEVWSAYVSWNGYYRNIPDMKSGFNQDGLANWLPNYSDGSNPSFRLGVNNNRLYIYQANTIEGVSSASTWKDYLSAHNLEIVYPLAEPITIYASNTAEIYTKAGLNNIFCDTGNIEVKYRRINNDL